MTLPQYTNTELLERIATALEALVEATGPGPTADCSTVIDQLCNIESHLAAIASYLEENTK